MEGFDCIKGQDGGESCGRRRDAACMLLTIFLFCLFILLVHKTSALSHCHIQLNFYHNLQSLHIILSFATYFISVSIIVLKFITILHESFICHIKIMYILCPYNCNFVSLPYSTPFLSSLTIPSYSFGFFCCAFLFLKASLFSFVSPFFMTVSFASLKSNS